MKDQLNRLERRCIRIETKLSRLMTGKPGLGPDNPQPMNEAQQVVLKSYCYGEFGHVRTMDEVHACGDGLFTFLMVELSNSEDCTSLDAAFNRVSQVGDQVRELQTAIDDAIFGGSIV